MAKEQTELNTEAQAAAEATGHAGDVDVAGQPSPESVSRTEAAVADVDTLLQEVEHWRQKTGENLDMAMRARAELDNVRKRTARDVENAHKYALEPFVKELLPVLDSLELGIAASHSAGDMGSHRLGLDLTLKMFTEALQKFGVAALSPQGEKFNPEKHQAVAVQDAAGAEPGTVVAVMQKGYELNGRLLRPAMVAVAR